MSKSLSATAIALAGLLLAQTAMSQQGPFRVPQDYDTIQEALDVAASTSPTDNRVVVRAGLYTENLVIRPGSFGLELVGDGKVIIDAHAPGQATAEGLAQPAGIEIQDQNITIRNLTIRHAAGHGIAAGTPGLGDITIDEVTILNADLSGISLDADDVTVMRSTLWGIEGGGVEVFGRKAEISHNTFCQIRGLAVSVTGDSADVTRNTVSQAEAGAMRVLGDNGQIDKNRISIVNGQAIRVVGHRAIIDRNHIDAIDDEAVHVTGNNPTVTRNIVSRIMEDTSPAMMVVSTGEGGHVYKNKISNVSNEGLCVLGNQITVSSNRLVYAGVGSCGLLAIGDANVLIKNIIQGSFRDGMVIDGSHNKALLNKVQDSAEDGIVVRNGTNNELDGNRIKGNQSEGVENLAADTHLVRNRFIRNRLQVASAVNVTVDSSNVFVPPRPANEPIPKPEI